jgi:PAS domain S-box-containing protein
MPADSDSGPHTPPAADTLAEALDSLPDAVTVVDYEFRVRYVNEVAAGHLRASGLDPASIVGKVLWEGLPPAAGTEWETSLRRAAAERSIVTFERHAPALGRWTETRIVPSANVMTAYTRDLTEQHEAERRADEGRALLHAILNNTTDAIFVKDHEGRYLAINSAGAAALHRTPEEVVGHTNFDFLPKDTAEALRQAELEVLRTGRTLHKEDHVRMDGVERHYLSARGLWRDAEGAVAGIVGMATDITERLRRERANSLLADAGRVLTESLDFRTTLNTVARLVTPALADWCSVVVRNDEGALETLAVAHADPEKVRWAREIAERYPIEPGAPTGVPNVVRTGRSELYPEITDEMLRGAATDAEHLELLRHLDMRSVMIVPMQAHGRTLGAITLIGAESGRQFTEADLPIAEELARRSALAIENAELFQAAASASRAKSEFLASMSHELRTPLNAILGYTSLLADGITGPVIPAQQEQLVRIRASATHLLGLIDEILSFSRLEAGREQLSMHDVDVRKVLDEATSLVRPMATAKRLPLETVPPEPADEPLYLKTDILKLRQILVNLLTNAIKFTDKGSVTLSAHAQGDHVVFSVKDTGIGIPPAHLEHVFDAFWQVEQAASRRVGGTGLGLSVTRRLARLLGGDVSVESTPGEGSTFHVTLPRGHTAREEGPHRT